jgi:hypothetical protein
MVSLTTKFVSNALYFYSVNFLGEIFTEILSLEQDIGIVYLLFKIFPLLFLSDDNFLNVFLLFTEAQEEVKKLKVEVEAHKEDKEKV